MKTDACFYHVSKRCCCSYVKRKILQLFDVDHNCRNASDASEPALINYKEIPERKRKKQTITRLMYEERNHFRNFTPKQSQSKQQPTSILTGSNNRNRVSNIENQPKTRKTMYDNSNVRYETNSVLNNNSHTPLRSLYRNPYEPERSRYKKVRFLVEDSKIDRNVFAAQDRQTEEVEHETSLVKFLKKLLQKLRNRRNRREEPIVNMRRPTMRVPEVHACVLRQKYRSKMVETKKTLQAYQNTYV